MSVFGVILVRIFPKSDWIRSISPYSVRMQETTCNSGYRQFLRSAIQCLAFLYQVMVLKNFQDRLIVLISSWQSHTHNFKLITHWLSHWQSVSLLYDHLPYSKICKKSNSDRRRVWNKNRLMVYGNRYFMERVIWNL